MDNSYESAGVFFVARGQPTKLLMATEKAFDFFAVQVTAGKANDFAVLFARNDAVVPTASTAATTASVS
jgi:hypothetical protein